MPTTPTYALPYPAAGDPADVPTDMQELAAAIEAGGVPGGELGYAQITANVSITATSAPTAQTIVTAPSVDSGGKPIYVEFVATSAFPAVGFNMSFHLFEDGTDRGRIGYMAAGAGQSLIAPVRLLQKRTPATGGHVYSLRAWVSGGTGTIDAGSGSPVLPAFIRVFRV